jgi:hypothetical protein
MHDAHCFASSPEQDSGNVFFPLAFGFAGELVCAFGIGIAGGIGLAAGISFVGGMDSAGGMGACCAMALGNSEVAKNTTNPIPSARRHMIHLALAFRSHTSI